MKTIDVDDELYRYIASHTQHIGESASEILRRMLNFNGESAISSNDKVQNDDYLQQLLQQEDFLHAKKVIDRFMAILAALYHTNQQTFHEATQALRGRTRLYFAFDKETLLQSGNHTKPQAIPSTPYWVITNTNSARKRVMIEQIMSHMGLNETLCEEICQYL